MTAESETNARSPWFSFAVLCLILICGIHAFFQYRIWVEWTIESVRDTAPPWIWRDGRPVSTDYIQFAAVSEAWRRGEIDSIYRSLEHQKVLMGQAAQLDGPYPHTLSYNYPPFFCWLMWPGSQVDYLRGLAIWRIIQIAFALIAVWMWRKELGAGAAFGAVTILWWLSPATTNNNVLGHASFTALAIVTGFLYLLNRNRDFCAGLVLSLLFYKPTLGILFGVLLIFQLRWKSIAGVAVGAGILIALSFAVSPTAVAEFPRIGRELYNLASTTEGFYLRHFTWLAFVCNAFGTTPAQLDVWGKATLFLPILAVIISLSLAWRGNRNAGSDRFTAACAATVLGTMFVTPYLYSYDTMLVAIAGVYSVKSWPRRPYWHRWLVLFCVTGICLYVAGDKLLLLYLDAFLPIRLQLAPVLMLVWMLLECRVATENTER